MNDGPTWEEIVEELHQPIYRYCMHLLRNTSTAEDATQQAFLKAFQAKQQPSTLSETRLWLFTIARNVCHDQRRWWRRASSFFVAQDTSQPQGASYPQHDLRLVITEALQKLSTRQYEVFVLRHWHGLSTEETAQILKIDPGSVKSHLKRAVDRLQNELGGTSVNDNQLAISNVE